MASSPEDSGIIFWKLEKIIINLEFYVQLNQKFGSKTGENIFRATKSKIVELLKDTFQGRERIPGGSCGI